MDVGSGVTMRLQRCFIPLFLMTASLAGAGEKSGSDRARDSQQTLEARKLLAAEVKMPAAQPIAVVVVRQPAPADMDLELTGTIRTFLQSKAAYASIRFTVQDRRVYMRAPNQDVDLLHEASRGIALLPGVAG